MAKNPLANAGDARDTGSIPGLGRSPVSFCQSCILERYQLTDSLAEAGAASTLFICPE